MSMPQRIIESPDVVVIGCGAGGGVIAKELAEAGISVVALEAGKRYNPATDYGTDREDFQLRSVFSPGDWRRDVYTSGENGFEYTRIKGVGGSTLAYLAVALRFHESDFRMRSEDGVGEDWPISYAEMEPYYCFVEHELGVAGPDGADANPFDPPRTQRFPTLPHDFNRASRMMKRGADKLGLHMVREPVAIPTSEWKGRAACISAGACDYGCKIAAKSSIDVTYIPKAEATGRIEIRSECMAREITVDKDGRARGVIYFDPQGREREIKARAVVLAGNAVETARLLLMSASSRFPNGLANSSGLVGKYFTEHLALFAFGLFAERLDPWRGIRTGGMIQDYYASKPGNDFARGWTFEMFNGASWPLSEAMRIPGWGSEHKTIMKRRFGHIAGMASVGDQLPDARNQVVLDPEVKDVYGLPVPRLINEPRENDRSMLKAISKRSQEIFDAAGALEYHEDKFTSGSSAHYLGTCRMGVNPSTSVVDAWCRTHDVPNLFIGDGSVFVTVAAVNPSLTISALATRTAEGIIDKFERREI
jgi:choline dehydrogenase-like flavoprotein